ncbi:MAG: CotH kinase family protein [Flavobacteriales bacterium]|nr:CotH kinase family protein [Flavobacteriales bacterium]
MLPLLLCSARVLAQTAPSDSLFNTDQVVTVDLDFGTQDFWTTLTTNYDNDLGETLTADITITDLTGTRMYYNVEVDLKGNSSYNHPGDKKSFKVDFNDNIAGQKYHGMAKVHFNNCWSDPTFMREKIFFDYCQDHGILAPRVSYANVSMNGTFWGFYNMVEAVDKDFLDRWVDDANGNLFKAGDNFGMGGGGSSAEADLKYYGDAASDYTARYELKTNETENDWTDLIELLDVLNNSVDAELESELPARFEWNGLLRSLAMDNMLGNLDSYINSARNYYLYHDSTTFLWNWIHWDANMAFGSYPAQGQNALTLSPTYVATNRPLMTKIMGIPNFRDAYMAAYCDLHTDFTNAYLDPRIDSIAAIIQPHVSADPNKQYTLAQFTSNITSDITVSGGGGGPGGSTIRGLKSFITARNTSLVTALNCQLAGMHEDEGLSVLRAWPNPSSGVLNIELPAGASMKDLQVSDALGRRVPVNVNGNSLDLSNVPAGLYQVVVNTADGPVMARVERL